MKIGVSLIFIIFIGNIVRSMSGNKNEIICMSVSGRVCVDCMGLVFIKIWFV